jgi:hypothetical protein
MGIAMLSPEKDMQDSGYGRTFKLLNAAKLYVTIFSVILVDV